MGNGPDCESRKLSLTNIERTWTDHKWLDLAGRDRPVRKRALINLDPLGGPNSTTTISLASTQGEQIIIREVHLTPLDTVSMLSTTINQQIRISPLAGPSNLDWHTPHDLTVSPGATIETERSAEQFIWVPPDTGVWEIVFTNDSMVSRARWCMEVEWKVARNSEHVLRSL